VEANSEAFEFFKEPEAEAFFAEAFFIKHGASASSNLATIFGIKYNKRDSRITICVPYLFIVVRFCTWCEGRFTKLCIKFFNHIKAKNSFNRNRVA